MIYLWSCTLESTEILQGRFHIFFCPAGAVAIPSRIPINFWMSDTFHAAAAGVGEKSFFPISTTKNGRVGSTAHSIMMLRMFDLVVLLQSCLINLNRLGTASFGELDSFFVKETNSLNIYLFMCCIPLRVSIRNRCVFLSTLNILLIDAFQVL